MVTIITLNNYIKNKKSIFKISIISSIIVVIISLFLFLILSNIDIEIATIEMPVVYVIGKMLKITLPDSYYNLTYINEDMELKILKH